MKEKTTDLWKLFLWEGKNLLQSADQQTENQIRPPVWSIFLKTSCKEQGCGITVVCSLIPSPPLAIALKATDWTILENAKLLSTSISHLLCSWSPPLKACLYLTWHGAAYVVWSGLSPKAFPKVARDPVLNRGAKKGRHTTDWEWSWEKEIWALNVPGCGGGLGGVVLQSLD